MLKVELSATITNGDAFSTAAWYATVAAHSLPKGAEPIFLTQATCDQPLVTFPLMVTNRSLSSLTTPYTCLWHPLFAPHLTDAALQSLGKALGEYCKSYAVTRLDSIDGDAPWLPPLLAGVGGAGLRPLKFDHFGNWFCNTDGVGWAEYLAQRPGKLRETIRRRTRHLMDKGRAMFECIDGADGLERALDAYEQVYARSWKQPEPYPAFNPALMRAAAADGTLRLGVLRLGGEPVAVQFWMVRDGWAGLQKLAHDETHQRLAPGTVLTGLMIRRLLDREHVRELDFGRGDDAYKQDWTGSRRQRIGILLANPRTPRGLWAIIRHRTGQVWRNRRSGGAWGSTA